MIIYTSPDLPMVGHIKNILELHGIATTIQTQFSSAAIGYIPPIECWPELWIVDKTQLKQAKRIVKETLKPEVLLEIKSGQVSCKIKTSYFDFSNQLENVKIALVNYHYTVKIK